MQNNFLREEKGSETGLERDAIPPKDGTQEVDFRFFTTKQLCEKKKASNESKENQDLHLLS